MGYIYKITNLQNNKIYIGKTTTCIQERFSKHMIELFNDLEPIYGYCISLDLATGKISPEEITKIYGKNFKNANY